MNLKQVSLRINRKQVAAGLFFVAVLLLFLHLSTGYLRFLFKTPVISDLYLHFNLSEEANVPTVFKSLTVGLAALTAWFLGFVSERRSTRSDWFVLAGILAFISFDEVATMHEFLDRSLHAAFKTSGLLFYPWLPFGLALAVFLLFRLWRLLFSLPADVRQKIVLAGVVYVFGAAGLDTLSGLLIERSGDALSLMLIAVNTAQEFLQMIGMIMIFNALLSHFEKNSSNVVWYLKIHE